MVDLAQAGRRAGMVGAAVGVVAAGAAVGLAAERYAVGRSFRAAGRGAGERFGALRGTPHPVHADDGTPLHVELDGSPDAGPLTVVFCHGFAHNQDAWHFQRRDLGDLGRLVFYDQRGHGRSGRGRTEHATIEWLGRDLLRVIEEVAPSGPLLLVGHSMGGMTVMALADAHPELFGARVVGVALLSTSPGRLAEVTLGVPAYAGRVLHRLAPRLLETLGRRPELVAQGWRAGSDLAYVLTKRYSFASDVAPGLVEFTAAMVAATPIETLVELFPAFDAHDKLAALDVLDGVETLVLAGADDVMTPAAHSRDIAARVPGAELVVVPRAGHLVILEHPEVVNRHLRALAARAARSTAA